MADREQIEILATHADKLNAGGKEEAEYLATLPEHRDALHPLLALARKVKDALAPLEPDPAFRKNLSLSLLAAARQRAVSRLSLRTEGSAKAQRPVQLFRRHRKEILIGAATLGSVVSVAGIVYWIHTRSAKTHRVLPG